MTTKKCDVQFYFSTPCSPIEDPTIFTMSREKWEAGMGEPITIRNGESLIIEYDSQGHVLRAYAKALDEPEYDNA